MHNKECQLMGLTWLLAKNRTAYIHTVTAVIRAVMMSTTGSDPRSCTLNSDGMPLAVDSSEFSSNSSSNNLRAPIYLCMLLLCSLYMFFTYQWQLTVVVLYFVVGNITVPSLLFVAVIVGKLECVIDTATPANWKKLLMWASKNMCYRDHCLVLERQFFDYCCLFWWHSFWDSCVCFTGNL